MEVQVYVEDQLPSMAFKSTVVHSHSQSIEKENVLFGLINRLTYKYMAQVLSVTWSPVSLLLTNNCKSFTTF